MSLTINEKIANIEGYIYINYINLELQQLRTYTNFVIDYTYFSNGFC